MSLRLIRYLFILIVMLPIALEGQFYNGHQMQFGKNRVQYNDFYWNYKRYDGFDTYFNEQGEEIADYTAVFAEKEIKRLESLFDYNLDSRIIFLVYNKLSDFKQSNIGLVTGKTESNIGGTIQIDKNKVFVYFEGDYKKFERQISGAISEILINEVIYGSQFRENAANSTLINLPEWYIDGLVALISKGWDFEAENRVKDGIISGKYKKFNRLTDEDAKYAGQSFWRYISESYGESVIPSILYLTQINKNANSGFYYVVGSSIKDLSKSWYSYNQSIYTKQDSLTQLPEDIPIKKRPKKKRVYSQMLINPSGNYIAYTTNHMGRYKVWLYDVKNNKHKKLFQKEHKLEQIIDYSYPALAWHPSGRILTFITEEEGGLKMYYYTFGQRQLDTRNMLYFEKILSYSFSPDGSLMAISGVKNGQSDIYIQNTASGSNTQVTNDMADDFTPKFINDGSMVMFASNRETDSTTFKNKNTPGGLTQDLFIYNYENRSEKLYRLADLKYINKSMPYEVGQNKFVSLSDKTGIINRYVSRFDSSITSVDTTVHYQYFAKTYQNTNYARNILEQSYNKRANTLGEVVFNKGKYYMYSKEFSDTKLQTAPYVSPLRIQHTKNLEKQDSINKIVMVKIPLDSIYKGSIIHNSDTLKIGNTLIDVNNYIFEVERMKMLNEKFKEQGINLEIVEDINEQEPKTTIYQKTFFQNYVTTQIDFSFLNESYQTFTGGAVYFNSGTNLLFKAGTHDLFEDYKITAGIRLPLDFQSSEYLIGLENLKKRINKQYFFHRQTFLNQTSDDDPVDIRNVTNQLFAVIKYPFSQVSCISTTVGLRSDKTIYLPLGYPSTIVSNLEKANTEKLWINAKAEFIFDNTRSLGLNLNAGTRFKFFGEAYQQANSSFNNLFVVGADIRNYIVIHRNFIWANRFAASGSFGSSKLIYYLGGVDNWRNFSSSTPTFIPLSEIRITPDENYSFQTVATNLRGFSQNIRNGSNFALINSELRLPIIRYLANYPLSNTFFENLQIVGFFDVGTAWTGISPWAKENGYDRDFIYSGSLEIEIDAERDPFVAGYGFGVRSQLLGYFIRLDWAWGIENQQLLPGVFYFSLALDF